MQPEPVLIIGESPGIPVAHDTYPLEGSVGARLAEYADLSMDDYLARTERRNLIPSYVAAWPVDLARMNAHTVFPSLMGRRTILLGRRVAAAFGLTTTPYLEWFEIADSKVAIVPHPSGRNLWWNEPENRAAARRFLTSTFETA